MPTTLQGDSFPLTAIEVEKLWQATRQLRQHADDVVAVRCLTTQEMQELNQEYRGKDMPTNVLTFSYPPDASWPTVAASTDEERTVHHDVALCLTVAEQEAQERSSTLRDYTALLLVHGFLHVTGLDHEHSPEEALSSTANEVAILSQCGFVPTAL